LQEFDMSLTRREVLSLTAGFAFAAGSARAAEPWTEGKHYFRIDQPPASGTTAPIVTEIFSYGCPACNVFQPYMQSLDKKFPATAMDYLPASWIVGEDWHVFQRAYLTAKALGVARKAHDQMFAAVWSTGELAVSDTRTGRPRSPLPSMQDVARFYQRVTGVPEAKFVETSRSFSVDAECRRVDALIKAYRAESTPTIVVNGKYRLEPRNAGTEQQAVDLVLWLARKI
jgi:thiol:disulfide interchange protein DsbA